MKSNVRSLRTLIIWLFVTVMFAHSFTPSPSMTPPSRRVCTILQSSSSRYDDDGGQSSSSPRRNQEMKMEMSSIAGAKAIRKLDLNERTKRAMLAEAVEDRIFELVDELEQVVAKKDGVWGDDEKEEAVELARQTKALQLQYDDLVNGRPSSLLDLGGND